MYPNNLDSYRDRRAQSGRQKQRGHPQRRRRRWPFFLLSIVLLLLLIVGFFIARYIIETSSDQSYVGPNNKMFLLLTIEPDTMVPTIAFIQLTLFNNKGQAISKASCYADAGSQPRFEYERHSVSWLESLLGYHAGIKLLQIDGCAPQLNCLLHPKAACITTINAVDNPQDQITTGSLPFGIPETGKGRVNYNIVTTQDGFAVSSQN